MDEVLCTPYRVLVVYNTGGHKHLVAGTVAKRKGGCCTGWGDCGATQLGGVEDGVDQGRGGQVKLVRHVGQPSLHRVGGEASRIGGGAWEWRIHQVALLERSGLLSVPIGVTGVAAAILVERGHEFLGL